jgi:hypothetical protein
MEADEDEHGWKRTPQMMRRPASSKGLR